MIYVEFLIDGEPYELELHPGMVFTKCVRCGKKIYGYSNQFLLMNYIRACNIPVAP